MDLRFTAFEGGQVLFVGEISIPEQVDEAFDDRPHGAGVAAEIGYGPLAPDYRFLLHGVDVLGLFNIIPGIVGAPVIPP